MQYWFTSRQSRVGKVVPGIIGQDLTFCLLYHPSAWLTSLSLPHCTRQLWEFKPITPVFRGKGRKKKKKERQKHYPPDEVLIGILPLNASTCISFIDRTIAAKESEKYRL